MSYSDPIQETIRLDAAAVAGGGVLKTFFGPRGKTGRILAFHGRTTTAFTVADSVVSIGPNAASKFDSTIEFTGSGIGDQLVATDAEMAAAQNLPADTAIEISSDGGSTAGAADLVVVIGWF